MKYCDQQYDVWVCLKTENTLNTWHKIAISIGKMNSDDEPGFNPISCFLPWLVGQPNYMESIGILLIERWRCWTHMESELSCPSTGDWPRAKALVLLARLGLWSLDLVGAHGHLSTAEEDREVVPGRWGAWWLCPRSFKLLGNGEAPWAEISDFENV